MPYWNEVSVQRLTCFSLVICATTRDLLNNQQILFSRDIKNKFTKDGVPASVSEKKKDPYEVIYLLQTRIFQICSTNGHYIQGFWVSWLNLCVWNVIVSRQLLFFPANLAKACSIWNVSTEWWQVCFIHDKRLPVKADEVCKARAQAVKEYYVDGTMFSAWAFTLGHFSVNLHNTWWGTECRGTACAMLLGEAVPDFSSSFQLTVLLQHKFFKNVAEAVICSVPSPD